MNTPDTPTPRTDEQVFTYPIMVEISDGDWEERQGLAIPADFARQLERELTAAKEELRMAVEVIDERAKERESLQAELALLRKRVEAADGLAVRAPDSIWALKKCDMLSTAAGLQACLAAYRATEGKK